jgi:hypothetical protein
MKRQALHVLDHQQHMAEAADFSRASGAGWRRRFIDAEHAGAGRLSFGVSWMTTWR